MEVRKKIPSLISGLEVRHRYLCNPKLKLLAIRYELEPGRNQGIAWSVIF